MFSLNPPKFYSSESTESTVPFKLEKNSLNSLSHTHKQSGMLVPTLIDFNWLAFQPLLPFLVQVLPANLLYRSLVAHGFEDSLEIIEWIRGEQLQKILDFDLWEKSFEFETEDISFEKVMSWLKVWLAIGTEFAAERFWELEEETMCLILSKLFEIIPEGVNFISEDVRENWWLTLDNKFFLRIRENADESFEILKQFVDCLYARDIRLFGSLFAYSAMLIRQETLDKGLRWRANRLSDQGFISREEALKVLIPKKTGDLRKSIEEAKKIEAQKLKVALKSSSFLFYEKEEESRVDFSPEDFDSIVKLLTSFEPEEGSGYMRLALGNEKIISILGSADASAENFYDDEDFINESAENILAITKNIVLNLEFRSTQKETAYLLIEKAIKTIASEDKQKLSRIKESISYLANCVTSGIETRFNYGSIERSVLVTRGAINIGLELCLKMPSEYGLNFKHDDVILNAIDCLDTLGASFLFHLGWNILFKLTNNLVEKIMDLDLNHPLYRGKLNTQCSIKLSDSSNIQVPLNKLVENLRFVDVEKWLASCENLFSNEMYYTIKALLNRIPLYPQTLVEFSNYVTKETRSFETLNDIDVAFNFINNLSQNLVHIG